MSQKNIRDYRPKLHFTTKKGWTNDPNGLVYENGRYHLFYQFYPHDKKGGPKHWGHAISKNLINWEHLPVALAPDELGDIYSGSAVYDRKNTSGFGTFNNPPIVAMFTHNGESQYQSIAYSTDGINFIKYTNNPVIKNPGIKDFRDPKIFYNPVKKCWSCVIAAGNHVQFYASKDLINWIKTGKFGPEGNLCPGVWECPDIFPLEGPNGEEVWILIVSMGMSLEFGGSRTQYFLGTFNGDTFICDRPFNDVEWIDYGFDNYAAVSYYSDEFEDKIIIGWASNWLYSGDTPTNEYCGIMTLPRKLSLVNTSKGLRLSSLPVSILGDIMSAPVKINQKKELQKEVFGLRIEGDSEFTIILSNESGEKLVFGMNNNNEIFMDRSKAGNTSFNQTFELESLSKMIKQRFLSGHIIMEVIFDVSVVEIFADNGTFASSQLVYPKKPYDKIYVLGKVGVWYYDMINDTFSE